MFAKIYNKIIKLGFKIASFPKSKMRNDILFSKFFT